MKTLNIIFEPKENFNTVKNHAVDRESKNKNNRIEVRAKSKGKFINSHTHARAKAAETTLHTHTLKKETHTCVSAHTLLIFRTYTDKRTRTARAREVCFSENPAKTVAFVFENKRQKSRKSLI